MMVVRLRIPDGRGANFQNILTGVSGKGKGTRR
jgi:hypothetical protein